MARIIVTGAAGYIGSCFVYDALKKGDEIYAIDNFSNSDTEIINYFKKKFHQRFTFFNIDLRDKSKLIAQLRYLSKIDFIMHFAALKSVPESENNKELYWQNNVEGLENLLEFMNSNNYKNIIFSSSAAVYGEQITQPIKESAQLNPMSFYASTKMACEKILEKYSSAFGINSICLRYFNPVGCHDGKVIKENFHKSGNLMSEILKASTENISVLKIYGNDYDTEDGTCERDFIHIQDLVDGHFSALENIKELSGFSVINLGTGKSCSVLNLINIFKKENDVDFKLKYLKRRSGDISSSFADVKKAKNILNWQSKYSLEDMCKDAWYPIKNEIN